MSKKVISRQEARENGLLRYFTGAECVNGHLSERQVSSGNCLACSAERRRARVAREPERQAKLAKAWFEANRDRVNQKRRERYIRNPEPHKNEVKNWYARNQQKAVEQKRQYHSANRLEINRRQRERNAADPFPQRHSAKLRQIERKRAMPSWFGELDDFVWAEAGRLVDLRASATGIKWAADHMLPIKAKTVTGLHVWNNCQVIPARLNSAKNNRLQLTHAGEWITRL